jgi:prephenate dehydrogenase
VRIGKLVVVGVGLIGGSFALALRAANRPQRVVGVGRARANLDTAQARGVIDIGYTQEDAWSRELQDADLVLVATPVAQYPALFDVIARAMGEGTIVTDAGSTKQDVAAAARATFGARLSHFVPGHPIAGGENSGAAAARAALFTGRNVVLTPLCETATTALATVTALWQACGARVTTMTPARHDEVFAAVSHLPHVLAFALVDEFARRPDGAALLAQAGGGFRDFTRIAASSPEMWRDIALANRDALRTELARYRDALAAVAQMIDAGDGDGLAALFERAATARQQWGAALPPSDDDGA